MEDTSGGAWGWSGHDADGGDDEGMNGLTYTPNLSPVGSGASYWPGDVSQDAQALAFLGYTQAAAGAPSTGSQAGDMASQAGAWAPAFRSAVMQFEVDNYLESDGWIGPNTRTILAARVAAKNASDSPIAPPFIPPALPPIPGVPANVIPNITPPSPGGQPNAPSSGASSLLSNPFAIALFGAAALLGVGYLALKD